MNIEKNTEMYLPQTPFRGTFRELLALVKKYPAMVESSKARLYRLIVREGINEKRSAELERLYGTDTVKAFNAFKMFYGTERSVHEFVVNYLLPATLGAEADKQAPVLIGPPSSGKSDWVSRLKTILRGAEPVPYNDACPVHDNPMSLLYMIPVVAERQADSEGTSDFNSRFAELKLDQLKSLGLEDLIDYNSMVKQILSANGLEDNSLASVAALPVDEMVSAIAYGLGLPKGSRNAIGAPCPHCQERILGEFAYKGKAVSIADFPVNSMRFTTDFQGSNGIVDVAEVQPLNFDLATWIGSENLALMGRVDARDPRAVNLNGAFNKGNRGIVILTEGLKNPPEAQRVLLEALQGRRLGLPAPQTGSLFFDGIILIHSNEEEYVKFINNKANEPYADRFWRIWFGYPLELSQDIKVLRKFFASSEFAKPVSEGGVHVEPMVFEMASRLQILTRIEPHPTVPLNVKLAVYDGREVRQHGMGTKITLEDLKNAASAREGLSGMSPRETTKILTAVASEALGTTNCITSKAYRDRLRSWFKSNVTDEKQRERLMGFIARELDESRKKEAQRVILASMIDGFKDECQSLFEKYVDNIEAYARHTAVRRPGGYNVGQIGGDETFMREIESDPDWGVTSAEAPKFRAEIMVAVNQYLSENRNTKMIPYTCHEAVRKCIERYVLRRVTSTARIFSSGSSRTEEDRKKLASAKDRLIADYGFCPHCADELLREVEENPDFLVEK